MPRHCKIRVITIDEQICSMIHPSYNHCKQTIPITRALTIQPLIRTFALESKCLSNFQEVLLENRSSSQGILRY